MFQPILKDQKFNKQPIILSEYLECIAAGILLAAALYGFGYWIMSNYIKLVTK